MKSNTEKKDDFNLYDFTVTVACNYMLRHNLSVRESAKSLGISKTTMQKYTQDIKLIDEDIYNKIQEQKQARLNFNKER